MPTIASYDEVKNLPKETYLIDVREPSELEQTGTLPNSINIPMGQLEAVITQMDNDEFTEKFGRDKPQLHDHLIFSCKLGGRANRAATFMVDQGFTNVQYYKGSWEDWAAHMNQ